MAEVAVATALGLVQIIIPHLTNLNYPINVKNDIESMRSWLTFMQAYIEHNSGQRRSDRTPLHLHLIHKVGKIAYDIEDVVDYFILHSPPYTFHRYKFSRKIHSYAHIIYNGFPLHRVSEKIADIRKAIDDVKSQTTVFSGTRHSDPGPSMMTNRAAPPALADDEMVGYEKPKAEFIRRLVDKDKRLVKLVVDGPLGSGKTTIVNNIFSKRKIQAKFDCHAWVCVSDRPDVDLILQTMLEQFCASRKKPYPSDDGTTLRARLHKYLAKKKFLLVLDDVWGDQDDWIGLNAALPDSFRVSRVIVTTRYSNPSSVYTQSTSHYYRCSLRGLESSDAWELFCRRAFPGTEYPFELKDISMNISKRCEGLPLAVVTVASALARKPQSKYEWERFHTNFECEIRNNSDLSPINEALLRSYMDLSSNLTCCFLYMSIFPEYHSIERGRLIRLWVAERFAMATEDHTAEEVAEDYLNELIQRNLIHVSNWDFDGRPRSCRVLNIVLKFIIYKSKDENFASVFPKENTNQTQMIQNQSQMTRRLWVHDRCKHFPGNGDFASARSLFLWRLLDIKPTYFEKNLRRLKLIKVIDVHGAPLTEFPKEMSRFTLMRYLSFRGTNISLIPAFIEKLSYLETLDLKQTSVTQLPRQISNLHNLRHLFVYKDNASNYISFDSVQGAKVHKGINKLTNLQKLSLVKIGRMGRILKDLRALTRL